MAGQRKSDHSADRAASPRGRKKASVTGGRRPSAGGGGKAGAKGGGKASAPGKKSPARGQKKRPAADHRAHKKVTFDKAGNMLYPAPAVLVSCEDPETGRPNVFTAAWAGNICTDPPMVGVSIRPERFSYPMIRESGEFVVNLTTEELVRAVDYCGVTSGRKVDKFRRCGFTPEPCEFISAPAIRECPVNLECEVRDLLELGTHDLFLAEVLSIHVDQAYLDKKGAFHLEDAGLIAYAHGKYFVLGKEIGSFGFSIRRK